MSLKIPLLFVAFFALSLAALAGDVTVILGAFDDEVRLLNDRLEDKTSVSFNGLTFSSGKLNGRPVIVAETGVGKVNAAMTTAVALERFQPREVIFTGIAGGIAETLNPGDLVIGEKLFQHDLGYLDDNGFRLDSEKNPIDGKRNPIFFESAPSLIALAKASSETVKLTPLHNGYPKIVTGLIATGDIFVASDAKRAEFQKAGVSAVEMEGASVAQVCYQQGVPFIVIRSLSDKADATARVDIKFFYMTAAANSAALVGEMAKRLAAK